MTNELKIVGDALGSTLSTAADAVESYVTGIPAPMRKGAIKAFGQLLSAAIELPLASIQGAVDEKKAEGRARVQIIEAQAKMIAEQINVNPAFVEAASIKYASKIVREQVNLDKIVHVSAEQLKHETIEVEDVKETQEVSDDWLNAFESIARNMSSEQMQALFGKILAGEIRKPRSFSIRTINSMAQLEDVAARLFRILASILTTIKVPFTGQILDIRVIGCGNPSQNTLMEFGLSFDNLNILQENGLIISEFNSNIDYSPALIIDNALIFPLIYNGKKYALRHKDQSNKQRAPLNVSGISLTTTGKELAGVVEKVEVQGYEQKVVQWFDDNGYIFSEVNINS